MMGDDQKGRRRINEGNGPGGIKKPMCKSLLGKAKKRRKK